MIAEAYKEEQAYLKDKLNGIDTSLPDRLKQHGFTLEEYQLAKRDYYFKAVRPQVIDNLSIEGMRGRGSFIKELIGSKKPSIIFLDSDKMTIAFVGQRDEIYEDRCKELGVKVYYSGLAGGTMLISPEDLTLGIALPEQQQYDLDYFVNRFLKLIQKREPNAYVNGNDIMVGSKKISGASLINIGNGIYFAINISFKNSSELAKQILPPRSIKVINHLKGDYKNELKSEIVKEFGGA